MTVESDLQVLKAENGDLKAVINNLLKYIPKQKRVGNYIYVGNMAIANSLIDMTPTDS